MTEEEKNTLKREIFEEIDEMLAGSERCITQKDDPSGCFTEWTLDSEAFREKLRKRIDSLTTT